MIKTQKFSKVAVGILIQIKHYYLLTTRLVYEIIYLKIFFKF